MPCSYLKCHSHALHKNIQASHSVRTTKRTYTVAKSTAQSNVNGYDQITETGMILIVQMQTLAHEVDIEKNNTNDTV